MNEKDKKLLLKDLCGRLPYGVIVNCDKEVEMLFTIAERGFFEVNDKFLLEDCKPYLRPISSMTEEEKKEYHEIDGRAYTCPEEYAHVPAVDRIDWLNAHHFDYRGLIEKGLALEAPDGIYKTK